MKPVRTLVMVANEREARLLVNEGVGKGLIQIADVPRDSFKDAEVAYADQKGRSQSGPGGARHGMEPSTSEQRQMRDRFAGHLGERLDAAWAKGSYDRLIVAAPPKMLGALRDAMPAALQGKLAGDLPKDLVRVPLNEMPGHFSDLAAF